MRFPVLIALVGLSSAPSRAQGIVVPMRCGHACPARALVLDSVSVFANVNAHARASTYVDHVIRNASPDTVQGAFFFPVPDGAEVERVWVRRGPELELYNEWTRPDEARLMLDALARQRPRAGLGAYAGVRVIHVRIPPIAPGEVKHLQIGMEQPLRVDGSTLAYRYPLSLGAAASPIGHLELGMEVRTKAGFRDIHSPSHRVRMQLGMESGPCQPQERCGTRGYPSHRVRVVRMEHADDARRRDFQLVYTPAPSDASGEAEQP